MAQMSTVGKVQTHQSFMWPHDGLVYLQIGGTSTQSLDIDTPPLRIKVEGFQCSRLACELYLVDELVASVVSCSGITLGVFVRHGCSESIEDGFGGEIFRGDQDN